MAAKVDAFIAALPNDDSLVLHADCTGGMRNAAMVMMAVLRLMQYDDRVSIGDILYSNWSKRIVERANNIYALFDLIAGAEEFVRFGSVQTLRDYYKTRDSKNKDDNDDQENSLLNYNGSSRPWPTSPMPSAFATTAPSAMRLRT